MGKAKAFDGSAVVGAKSKFGSLENTFELTNNNKTVQKGIPVTCSGKLTNSFPMFLNTLKLEILFYRNSEGVAAVNPDDVLEDFRRTTI
jgi:hypothetical protein